VSGPPWGSAAAVAAVASAQATYAWLRSFVARRPALGGTLFHVASPYYLAFDHYRAGGTPRVWRSCGCR
jgi:hypothetical protein